MAGRQREGMKGSLTHRMGADGTPGWGRSARTSGCKATLRRQHTAALLYEFHVPPLHAPDESAKFFKHQASLAQAHGTAASSLLCGRSAPPPRPHVQRQPHWAHVSDVSRSVACKEESYRKLTGRLTLSTRRSQESADVAREPQHVPRSLVKTRPAAPPSLRSDRPPAQWETEIN